ncbi:hypothetical protein [Aureibaculum luteum]|uniref:hypothetical protein n=1 Tax=Aureibaculum luteum TaxID=1548456 RepID=UPI000E4FFBB8|nr:hypothetical protein [Aureibaculum luteum]
MKTHYYLLLVVLFCISIPNTVEGQNKKGKSSTDLLLGTWTFDYDSSLKNIDKSNKSQFDSLPKQQRSEMKSIYLNRQIVFEADGNFTLLLADKRKSTGTWKLSENDKYILFTSPNGKVFIQKIEKLSATDLIVKLKEVGDIKAFISKLHYTKNQK